MPYLQPSITKQGTVAPGTVDGTDLYVPASGGNITGDLTVDGTLFGTTVQAIGYQFDASSPTAASCGTSTLVAGQSPVINTTLCLGPQTIILLQRTDVNASTSLGELRVRQRNAGNFLVESDGFAAPGVPDTGDVSSFNWVLINVF